MMFIPINFYLFLAWAILPIVHGLSSGIDQKLSNSTETKPSKTHGVSDTPAHSQPKSSFPTSGFNGTTKFIAPTSSSFPLSILPTHHASLAEKLSLFNSSVSVHIRSLNMNTSLNTITKFSPLEKLSESASRIGSNGFYNASAASLSFNQLPACTESWWSRLAANNGTVLTTRLNMLTISLSSNSTTLHIPGGSAGIDVTGPTTRTFTMGTVTDRLRDDDVCCGSCNIRYPNVIVYYWPVHKNKNTWCLQYLRNSSSTAFVSTGTLTTFPLSTLTSARSGPTLLSDIPPGSLTGSEIAPHLPKLTSQGRNPNSGPRVGFGAFLPGRALPDITTQAAFLEAPKQSLQPRTFVPLNESKLYAVVDGSTFISPTVYVIINTLKAVDKCKTVGHVFTSLTLAFQENQLSTVDDMFGEIGRAHV